MTSGRRRAASPRARPAAPKAATPCASRDQAKSSFTTILESLLVRLPGAFAVSLVDSEGESVDYAGDVDPFEVRVAAAHLQLVLEKLPTGLGSARALVVRGALRSFIAYALPEGYAVVVLLRRRAAFTAPSRAFLETERELAREAGWAPSRQARNWYPVRVICDKKRRPVGLRAGESSDAEADDRSLEILGTVASGLQARESGYRVRTDSGVEMTLVREPGGRWYAEDAPVELEAPKK